MHDSLFQQGQGGANAASLSRAALGLLAQLPQPVIVLDNEMHVLGWNDTADQCFGLAREHSSSARIDDVVLSAEHVEAWHLMLESGEEATFEHQGPNGETFSLTWWRQPVLTPDGAPQGWICLAKAPTGKPKPALKERILDILLDNLPISIWAVNREGTYIFHDGLGVEAVGVKRHAFLGLNVWELWKDVPGTEETMRQVRVAMHDGTSSHAFAEAMDRHWESWCIPARDSAGHIDAVISATIDITSQKRLEGELRQKLELVERQQKIIRDLATPILQVSEGVLAVPLIGVVDSARSAELMDDLLGRVTSLAARHVIMDLTGVDTVDTSTAAYLINLVRAVRLLGAEAIITGIRPSVAQTIISVGVDLSGIPTRANLRSGLEYCMRRAMATSARDAGAKVPVR